MDARQLVVSHPMTHPTTGSELTCTAHLVLLEGTRYLCTFYQVQEEVAVISLK